MGSVNDTAAPSFDVKVIGAGIAGLAAALALRRKGIQVTVFESNPELSEFGAGIQLQPNASRVIHGWGLEDEFHRLSNEPEVMKVSRYSNNAVIGEIAQNPMLLWEYGFPQWQCYRPDFQMILYNAAVEAGVEVKFGHRVKDVGAEKGELVFDSGSKVTADLIVAADGITSKTRENLPGNDGIKAVPFVDFCFRTVIPKAKMDSDPETAELMRGEDSMVWCGPGVTVLGYPVSGGELYNTLIACPRHSDVPVGRWNQPGDLEEARNLVKDFCSAVRKTWSYVDQAVKWTLAEVPKVESYTSRSGKVVIVGDAAHAMPPHVGQGGGMALEDADALAEFVSSRDELGGLGSAMKLFQEFRQPRVETFRRIAYGNQKFMSLEDGPEQEQRDKLWGMMTQKWKQDVRDHGEEGIRSRPRPEPVPGDDMRSPESRQWACGYDVHSEALQFIKARVEP